jgi:hypothetical protein
MERENLSFRCQGRRNAAHNIEEGRTHPVQVICRKSL